MPLAFHHFEKELLQDTNNPHAEAARESLEAGFPIFYGDDKYPGRVIREYPGGHKELVFIETDGTIKTDKFI